MSEKIYDLAIIGGGPAGVAAGVYASRKRLSTVFITEEWGGQSNVSEGIENWIGTIKLSGQELANNLKDHLLAYANNVVDVKEGEKIEQISKADGVFTLKNNKDEEYKSKTVLVATGSHRRKLDIPGAEEFDNKGLTYCASCDGPLFADKDTVVVGGGNAGFETAAQLLAYAKSVTLLHRRDEFKADPITVKKVLKNPKMKAITNVEPSEIIGDKFVTGIEYKDRETGEKTTMDVDGVFVEIGLIPTTYFVKDIVDLNDNGQIPIDCRTQKSELGGLWAAGDCSDILYHQNNIAAGDAVRALEDIYMHLQRME